MDINKDFLSDLNEDGSLVDVPNIEDGASQDIHDTPPQEVHQVEVTGALESIKKYQSALHHTKDLIQHVMEANGVCQEDVKFIDQSKPGLINDRRVLGQFTKDRSSVFMTAVTSHLQKCLEEETRYLTEATKFFFKEPAEDVKHLHEQYEVTYRPQLVYMLDELNRTHAGLFEKYATSANFVVGSGGESFTNLLDEGIAIIKAKKDDILSNLKAQPGSLGELDTYTELFNNVPFLAFFEGVLHDHQFSDILTHAKQVSVSTNASTVTYRMMLDFVHSSKVKDLINEMEELLDETIQQFDKISKEVDQIEEGAYSADSYLLEHHDEFQEIVDHVEFVEGVLRRMLSFLPLMNRSCSFLASLA
jgi:hypothetical protein